MGSSVPLRTDFDVTRLRCLARKGGDNRQIRRLLSLAAVYGGMNRSAAAKIGEMTVRHCAIGYTVAMNRSLVA